MRFKRGTIVLLALLLVGMAAAAGGVFLLSGGDNGAGPVEKPEDSSIASVEDSMSWSPSDGEVTPTGGEEALSRVEPSASAGDVAGSGEDSTSDAAATAVPGAGPKEDKLQSSLAGLQRVYEDSGPLAAEDYAAGSGISISDDSATVVLETSETGNDEAEKALSLAGGSVQAVHDGLIQASVPIANIAALASSPSIDYIREPERPALFTVSEGVADIGADTWQGAGIDGTGVKVAVLDPGFSGYDQRVAEGELPAGVITASFRADGDITGGGQVHGTACAELVYDVAPGAQLYLVNFSTDVELGNAVDYLISQGVDIVSASWGFYGSFRGDGQGPIDTIAQNARNAGIFWANAAGNAAETHWSGPFIDDDSDQYLEFAPGDETNSFYASAGSSIDAYLTWNRWPATDQDYDIYLVWEGNPTKTVAAGDSWQSGSQEPSEALHYNVPAGKGGNYWVVIKEYSADGNAEFQLYVLSGDLEHQVAAGSLGGQPTDSPDVMTVGAVPVGGTALESFSSQGPTLDGRIKPDIVAPDRTSTVTYGITGFWGTSAAAPHTAGAAALALEEDPALTPVTLQSYLESRATDLGAPGKDSLYGSGKLNLGPLPDHVPPQVTAVLPAGTVDSTSAMISVYYQDSGSGIDTASVDVTLDGSSLTGCTVTTSRADCPVTGLAQGSHGIGGTISDNDGNSTPISGAFDVSCGIPQLSLGSPVAYWASLADYQASLLTVSFALCNNGSYATGSIGLLGAVNSGGVTLDTPAGTLVPTALSSGQCSEMVLKYKIPIGISTFRTTVYILAEDACSITYEMPGPFPG
jgi:hypothetical protein